MCVEGARGARKKYKNNKLLLVSRHKLLKLGGAMFGGWSGHQPCQEVLFILFFFF